MGKKFYAIKEGFDKSSNTKVVDKIVTTWDECLKLVSGVKGAKYKSFPTIKEAEAFIYASEDLIKKSTLSEALNTVNCYVDGSYNSVTGKYSYALVVVSEDVITYVENGCAADDKLKDLRQIAGELKAAVRAAEYCKENNIKDFSIVHDYAGVCYHATGFWERRENSSKEYYEKMNWLKDKGNLNISFIKVDSHTGDLYNEIADELAKAAGEVTVKGETKKLIKNKGLLVENMEVKKKILSITGEDCGGKIVVME